MRTLTLITLGLMLLAACGDDGVAPPAAGERYTLTTINGRQLPYRAIDDEALTLDLTGGSLEFSRDSVRMATRYTVLRGSEAANLTDVLRMRYTHAGNTVTFTHRQGSLSGSIERGAVVLNVTLAGGSPGAMRFVRR